MDISLSLTEQSAADYATYYNWTEDSGVSLQDFVTAKILERIANDCTEQANRTAIAGVAPVTDITSDGSQTALREAAATMQASKQRSETLAS